MAHASSIDAGFIETYSSSNLRRYTTANPLYRWHVNAVHRRISALVQDADPERVLDAGCGEGFGLYHLAKRAPGLVLTGIDIDREAVAYARMRFGDVATFAHGSIFDLPYEADAADLVLCSEVLEHLSDPGAALAELKRVARTHVLVTVPREPFFRALNNLAQWLGVSDDPGHVQFWNHAAFRAFIRDHFGDAVFDRVHVYQLALCRV